MHNKVNLLVPPGVMFDSYQCRCRQHGDVSIKVGCQKINFGRECCVTQKLGQGKLFMTFTVK